VRSEGRVRPNTRPLSTSIDLNLNSQTLSRQPAKSGWYKGYRWYLKEFRRIRVVSKGGTEGTGTQRDRDRSHPVPPPGTPRDAQFS
jgi:hypothetical protein